MREIEFRGKLIKSNKWAYGNLDIKKTGTTIITPDDTPIGTYERVVSETIGQYTGLKDKNGKKIFEGDIVAVEFQRATKRGKAVISYLDKYAGFVLTNTGEVAYEYEALGELGDYQMRYVEVIGNIWDNPELLKDEL